MITRRNLIAGSAAVSLSAPGLGVLAQSATPAASPIASPVAAPPTSSEVVPAWLDAQEALRERGQTAAAAFMSGDLETLIALASPEIATALQTGFDPADLIETYTGNQIQFAFHEVGAWFFGQYTPEAISGVFSQGGPIAWEATPEDAQTSDVPTGTWNGVIGPGVIDLGIMLEFSGDAELLEVNLSIPSQMLLRHPMTDVLMAEEIPVGEMVDERVLPMGGDVVMTNMYAQQYAWGSNTLMLLTVWNGAGEIIGLNFAPQGTLPEIETPEPIVARLPFDGAWAVFWGGETEFRNYHAPAASQRHAVDLVVWRDGATTTAPGTANETYHAFGQPYLAPVDGTVAAVLDGLDDIAPQASGSNPNDHPAGNHVVIESDGGFVYLAHCQNGSIQVQVGDTVAAGDVVAAVGNSGNTSEPHVHIHAQTTLDMFDPAGIGIPLIFEGAAENGEPAEQLSLQQGTIVEHDI